MAYTDEIREDIDELRERAEQSHGTPHAQRLEFLCLLKQNPEATLVSVGTSLGLSERTIQRWWERYKQGGIDRLLEVAKRGRKRGTTLPEDKLERFRQKLGAEGFASLDEAQAWLEDELDVTYSRTSVWNLMRAEQVRPARWKTGQNGQYFSDSAPLDSTSNQIPHVIPEVALTFMNSLPTTTDVVTWINDFREALRRLLGDVDRISINVNTHCNLQSPESYNISLTVRQHMANEESEGNVNVNPAERNESAPPSHGLLDEMQRKGFNFKQFHSPHCFDYYYQEVAYLGSVILWRSSTMPPISEQSIETIQSLKPFMIFALTDLIVRHQQARPIDTIFNESLGQLREEAGLSPQESRIVVLQLLGHSYKDMADVLAVSVDTIKKHIKQIHRKTNTRGQSELFAKYFTSRISLQDEKS